jgi:hypothetical protein
MVGKTAIPSTSDSSGSKPTKPAMSIYDIVNRIHNILYGGEGLAGLDAVRGALPIIAYLLKKSKDEAEMEKNLTVLLADLRNAQNSIIAFVVTTRSKLYRNTELDQFLTSVETSIANMQITTLRRFLEALKNEDIIKALMREDVLGALFEKMVYNEFKGGGGKYLTHRNMVITMREFAWALIEGKYPNQASNYTVYDPCTGSSRFLAFWMDKVKKESNFSDSAMSEYASQHMFGTDKFPEMVGISGLNMVIHGNGVSNIFRADATDHFGFLSDFGSVVTFLNSFNESWPTIKGKLIGSTFTQKIQEIIAPREDQLYSLYNQINTDIPNGRIVIDMNNQQVEALYQVIYTLARNEYAINGLPGLRKLAERASFPCIHFLMKYIWSRQNPEIRKGFNLIFTNPPMGRIGKGKGGKGELQVSDVSILSQYALATKSWIPQTQSSLLKQAASNLGISGKDDILRDELRQRLKSDWITAQDLLEHRFEVIFKDSELDWEYSICYKNNWEPVLLQKALPVQVLLLEQFTRVVQANRGMIFSVIDVGVLNNPGDEYVRQFLFREKAKIRSIVEMPHGAFRYCGAGSKTGLLLYERMNQIPTDYQFFAADVKHMGYDIRSEEATPQPENDLPRAICEWKASLGLELPTEHKSCEWEKNRVCPWWNNNFELVSQ